MAEYNTVKISSVYLTDDGLITGRPCRIDVTGLDALSLTSTGAIAIAADGSPYAFVVSNTEGQGVPIRIAPFVLTPSVLNSLKTAINAAVDANLTINITISGDTGAFDLQCLPAFPKPVEFSGKFFNGRIYETAFNFVVVSVN